jgi:hypothetical protein
VLISVGAAVTTVLDGPGGFLLFRRWELVTPPEAAFPSPPSWVWKVTGEFMLGSMGRETLAEMLTPLRRRKKTLATVTKLPTPKPGYVPGSLQTDFQQGKNWFGVVLPEAATYFSDGKSRLCQPRRTSLDHAKQWTLSTVTNLLKADQQLSQALVIGPGGIGYELDFGSFMSGNPSWIDVQLDETSTKG